MRDSVVTKCVGLQVGKTYTIVAAAERPGMQVCTGRVGKHVT